jgi:hypothetical protein
MELDLKDLDRLSDSQLKFLKKHKLNDDQLAVALAVDKEARSQKINPDFVWPMVYQESKFNVDAKSPKGAFGVMQLMEDTAKDLKVDRNDVDQNIHGGISLLKELISNPTIGNDPYKVLAGYNASTETRNKFYESGNLDDLPDETLKHMHAVAKHYGGDLPDVSIAETTESENQNTGDVGNVAKGNEIGKDGGNELKPPSPSDQKLPRKTAAAAGAVAGTLIGTGAAGTATGLRLKYDAARALASYPEVVAALKAGKSPAEAMDIVFKGKAGATNLPPAQGGLEGDPAGGYQTKNWVASGDSQGRYTDVGLNARDKAEAHQMKLKAMQAEDKIAQIAPEMKANPNRAGLFLPENAGGGPRGKPNVPIPPVTPTVPLEAPPSIMGGLTNAAKNYLPYLKLPFVGALTGANLAGGAADVYNKVNENKPVQAGLSAIGTAAGTAMPFVGTSAALALGIPAAYIPAFLALQNDPEAKKKFLEGMSGKGAIANRERFGLD